MSKSLTISPTSFSSGRNFLDVTPCPGLWVGLFCSNREFAKLLPRSARQTASVAKKKRKILTDASVSYGCTRHCRWTPARYYPSGRARLTDAACQAKCLPDTVCQGKGLLDAEGHDEAHPDEVCPGIRHLDAARVFLTQRFNANVFQTQLSRRKHPDTAVTAPSHLPSGHNVSYGRKVSMQMGSRQGLRWPPHIGNRAVTVVASRCDRQGIAHCSVDYQPRSWF